MATVLDLFSHKFLVSPTSEHPDAELAGDAIKMAAAVRGGRTVIDGVIFHADSETVAAGFPGFLTLTAMDTTDAGVGRSQGFLTLTRIDEVLSFLGSVGSLGTSGEALRLAVGVT